MTIHNDMTAAELHDANVRAIGPLARTVGLTPLLVKAFESNNRGAIKQLLREALRLLGESTSPQ